MLEERLAPAEHARRIWAAAPARVRGGAIALAAAIVVAACVLAVAGRDTSVPLYAAALAPPQVAEVGDRLASWGVPFRATADGVEVPRALRRATLLRLSLVGIPHRPLPDSLEALADAGPLIPERVLEARQRAGLEGEVAQALRTLDGVADARVIVAPGRQGTFLDESSEPTTASVRLSLRAGERLDPERVRAVRAFVAASVPGLAARRVEVLDDRGGSYDEAAARVQGGTLQAQLQSALDRVEGEGATLVRVRVVREDDAREVVRRSVVPAGGALRSESAHEAYHGGGTAYQTGKSAVEGGSDEREERATLPAGRVRRISVAVFLDRRRAADASKIRDLVEAASGFDLRRGDEVRVETLDFAHPAAPRPGSPVPMMLIAMLPAIVFAAAAVAIAWATLPLARAAAAALRGLTLRRAVERAAPAYDDAHRLRAALDVEPPHAVAAVISALPASTAVAVLDLYPAEERERIVRRMATARTDVVPPLERILGKHS
ncbi:MAG TPA: flagellar M-ring protein FliF C-terminal domain-containing protein [Candidatus Dormibacteraeota bacterium]|nr:flagellar M-ring protein FliF C-terminal domain-containing protein [Candidatus Dormibacteraeota bacterium]